MLTFKLRIREAKKGDLSDLVQEHEMVVGAKRAQLNISETAAGIFPHKNLQCLQ